MNHHAGSATGIDLARLEAYANESKAGDWHATEALAGMLSEDAVLALIALARATPQHPRPTDDELWDATLRDRDQYHEWADKLAGAIAIHFGVDIGEHSNMNLPWAEALDAIESAPPPAAAAATPQHSVTEQDERALRNGRNLMEMAKHMGWPDDGEGAYEFVQRRAYELGQEDARAQLLPSTAATQPEQASIPALPGCLADRLYEAISIASERAEHAGSAARMAKWDATSADLRAALAIPASTAASEQQAERYDCPECKGAGGTVKAGDCSDCNGSGYHWEPVDSEQQASVSALNDPKMAAYLRNEPWISAYVETLECELKKAQAALSGRATIPSEADERKNFEDWSLRNYRHAEVYSQRDYDIGLAAWQAALTHRATNGEK